MLAWRGPFNPEEFAQARMNNSLKRAFYRRPAVKRSVRPDVPFPATRRTRIAPGTTLLLALTDKERDLILKHSLAEESLTRRLRIVARPGHHAVVLYTLDELEDLAGYVASEANHAKTRKLQKEWQAIHDKMAALLESYTYDEN